MSIHPGAQRRPLTGPEQYTGSRFTHWIARAVLLLSFGALGAAAGGAVVGFTSTTVGWDQLGEFIIGAAIGTGLAILVGSIIIMRSTPRGVMKASGLALVAAVAIAGAIWLRVRAANSAEPELVPMEVTVDTADPGP